MEIYFLQCSDSNIEIAFCNEYEDTSQISFCSLFSFMAHTSMKSYKYAIPVRATSDGTTKRMRMKQAGMQRGSWPGTRRLCSVCTNKLCTHCVLGE